MAPASENNHQDYITRGIAFVLSATFFIVVMNALAKLLNDNLHTIEIVFYRNATALCLVAAVIFALGKLHLFRTERLKGQFFRAAIGNTNLALVFWAYSLLPMADVTALLFAAPLFLTALSPVLLRERVGKVRWAAVVVGFGGVLLVAQPSGDGPLFGSFIALAAAFGIALVGIFLRSLGKTEDALTTSFYFLLFGTILSGILLPLVWSGWHSELLWLVIAVGCVGFLNQILKTQAYRLAPASVLSPFSYTSILWATLFGWLIWHDFPSSQVIAGSAILIASTLAIWYREWRLERKRLNL